MRKLHAKISTKGAVAEHVSKLIRVLVRGGKGARKGLYLDEALGIEDVAEGAVEEKYMHGVEDLVVLEKLFVTPLLDANLVLE
jgi:hypothetical protein